MTGEQRKLVELILAMFTTGNTSSAATVFSPSYLDHQGLGEPANGPDGFRRVVEAVRRAYDHLAVELIDAVAEGDKVAMRLRWLGGRDGELVTRETLDLLRFEGGRVVEHWGSRLWRGGS